MGSRDEAETEQICRGQTGSWIGTCRLFPEDSGQSVSHLTMGGGMIGVTFLKRPLWPHERKN